MITSFRILGLAVPPIALALGLAPGQRPQAPVVTHPGLVIHPASQPVPLSPGAMHRTPRRGAVWVTRPNTEPVVRVVPSSVERAPLGPSMAY